MGPKDNPSAKAFFKCDSVRTIDERIDADGISSSFRIRYEHEFSDKAFSEIVLVCFENPLEWRNALKR